MYLQTAVASVEVTDARDTLLVIEIRMLWARVS